MAKKKGYTSTTQIEQRFTVIRAILAIAVSLLFCFVLIFISSDKPFSDILTFIIAPLTSQSRFALLLIRMSPLLFTSLAMCVLFSANTANLAVEGAFYMAAFSSAAVSVLENFLPAPLHFIVAALAGCLGAIVVLLIPAVLELKFNANIVVCSLMLNYIIMYVIKFLMNTYLADKSKGQIMSYPFRETAAIAPIVDNKIFAGSKLTWGFVVAIIAVIICGLFMYRSRWGYAIRMIGINQDFTKYSGMNVAGTIVLSQVVGGFLAGAGGGIELLGRYNTFSWSALPGYGWTGITIAILAGNNPYMVPLAAFFMAYLSKGCDLMATYAKVPAQLIDIVQGVIFLFFAAEQFLSGYKQKLVVQTAQEEIARQNAMKAQEG